MARCLDANGEGASLLDKKLKELMAESISRKQKEGRKRSRVEKELAEEDKQRRFVELHEQFERLVAELPPAKERTEEQKAELQRMVKEKCKMKKKLDGKVNHLIPEKAAMSSAERKQKSRERKTDYEKQQEREAGAESKRRTRKK